MPKWPIGRYKKQIAQSGTTAERIATPIIDLAKLHQKGRVAISATNVATTTTNQKQQKKRAKDNLKAGAEMTNTGLQISAKAVDIPENSPKGYTPIVEASSYKILILYSYS